MGILSQGRSSVSQGREDLLCMLDLPSGDSPTAGVDLVFQDLPLSSIHLGPTMLPWKTCISSSEIPQVKDRNIGTFILGQ